MKKSVVWIESRWFHKTDISASPLSVSCQTRSVFNSTWPYLAREHTRPDISHQIFPLFSVLTVEVNFLLTVEVSPAGNLRWQLYIRGLWRAEDLQQNLLDTCLKKFSSKYLWDAALRKTLALVMRRSLSLILSISLPSLFLSGRPHRSPIPYLSSSRLNAL